jgi:signal transduction histidine kinase
MKPSRMFRSIRVRLTLWYVLLLSIVLILFGAVLYVALQYTLADNLDDILLNSPSVVINSLQIDDQGHLSAGPEAPLAWSDPERGEHFWRVLDLSGQTVAQSGIQDLADWPVDAAAIAQILAGQDLFQTVHSGDVTVRMYTAPVIHRGQIVGVVQQGLSMEETLKILATFRWILLLVLPLTLALASGGGYFLAGRALHPVDQITRAAQTIGTHDLSQRLNLDLPDDELGRLARAFDDMIARLDEAFGRQRRFTADASHELRTPLTIIKGNLSLALAHPREAEYYRQVMADKHHGQAQFPLQAH